MNDDDAARIIELLESIDSHLENLSEGDSIWDNGLDDKIDALGEKLDDIASTLDSINENIQNLGSD